jgi:uncharacterized lipoprotein YddW (UPF0748 family)
MKSGITALLIFLLFTGTSWAGAVVKKHIPARRGVFITVLQEPQALSSRLEIDRLVEFSVATRMDDIYIQVYRANQSWFASTVSDDSPFKTFSASIGEDPLALLIKQAHAKHIKVHAWLNLLSLSKNTKSPILKKFGVDILTRNNKEKIKLKDYEIDNQYFLEPGDLRVRQELSTMVEELLSAYPQLDGIQFDYIRYPDTNPHYGYSAMNALRYKEATKTKTIIDTSVAWHQWKRDQVTALLEKLVRKARKLRPDIEVSTTGCSSYIRAYEEAFQDWPSWVNKGLVDFVTVMTYPDNPAQFDRYIKDAFIRVNDPGKINITVGAYKLTKDPAMFKKQWDLCETMNNGRCVLFHYGNILEVPVLKDALLP